VVELQKRTRYDIYLDVLETVRRKKAVSITRLSYGAGLPVDRTRKIVEFLISRGLLKAVNIGDRQHYRLTERGGEFLQALKTVKKFIQ
jgi:predicted transcriptional regulator